MHTIKKWLGVLVLAATPLTLVAADLPKLPPGVTGSYETVNAPVKSVYTANEGNHKFVAYVVEWKGARVVVSDPLALSDYKVGDTIAFMAQKTTIYKPGQEVASLSFTLIPTPPLRGHSNTNEQPEKAAVAKPLGQLRD